MSTNNGNRRPTLRSRNGPVSDQFGNNNNTTTTVPLSSNHGSARTYAGAISGIPPTSTAKQEKYQESAHLASQSDNQESGHSNSVSSVASGLGVNQGYSNDASRETRRRLPLRPKRVPWYLQSSSTNNDDAQETSSLSEVGHLDLNNHQISDKNGVAIKTATQPQMEPGNTSKNNSETLTEELVAEIISNDSIQTSRNWNVYANEFVPGGRTHVNAYSEMQDLGTVLEESVTIPAIEQPEFLEAAETEPVTSEDSLLNCEIPVCEENGVDFPITEAGDGLFPNGPCLLEATCKNGDGMEELCQYHAIGQCRFGDACVLIHGLICEYCGKGCLHPTDEEQRAKHSRECIAEHEKNMELSFAVARSSEKTCGICMEVIMEKMPEGEQRFGILPSCNHCFCVSCIRTWRQAKQFENKIIRACPECRVTSDFVCPSRVWVETKEDKEKLIENYKKAMSKKPCRYYKHGNGTCPFGNKCFYLHALPSGVVVDVGPPRRRPDRPANANTFNLWEHWDVLDDWEAQWLDLAEEMWDTASEFTLSDSDEDGNDSDLLSLVESESSYG